MQGALNRFRFHLLKDLENNFKVEENPGSKAIARARHVLYKAQAFNGKEPLHQ